MDDLKLFGKSDDEIDSLIQTVFIFSEDISMEFGVKKCEVVILKIGKLVLFDGIHLPNQEIMKEVDKNGHTYLGILELGEIKEHGMKIKVIAEYKRKLRLILKSKLNGKNKIHAINTWAVALLRYGAGIINWKVSCVCKFESNNMLLKGVKKVGIVKIENPMEKEDFKKNSQNEFKNK